MMKIVAQATGCGQSIEYRYKEVTVKVIARFPACPESRISTASAKRSSPARSDRTQVQGRKALHRPVSQHVKKSVFPARSVTLLAIIAAGIWGLALRNEWVENSTDADSIKSSTQRQPHWVAREPRSKILSQGVRSE